MLIDDDEMILELLAYWFKRSGYQIKEFTTGHLASSYILENPSEIDLIILDRLLPDMDGISLLPRLPKNIPLLFLSVLFSEHELISSEKRGMIDYISKPFCVQSLLERAKTLIAKN